MAAKAVAAALAAATWAAAADRLRTRPAAGARTVLLGHLCGHAEPEKPVAATSRGVAAWPPVAPTPSIVRVRVLSALLLTLLVAIGLALAAYAAVWALRREPVAAVAPAFAPTATPIPPIDRLPDSPDFARATAPAPQRGDAPLVALSALVQNAPADWPSADAGLAIAPARGGDGVAWLPLATSVRRDDGWLLRHVVPAGEDYVLALAAARPGALRSFLARTTARVDGPTAVTIDARAALVTFRPPAGANHHGAFRLVRDGADGWLPADAQTGLIMAPETPLRVWLGAGAYRLVDVLYPDRAQTFIVPDATDVTVSASLAAVRADRR